MHGDKASSSYLAQCRPIQMCGLILTLVLLATSLTACETRLDRRQMAPEMGAVGTYRLDSGDELRITVFEQASLSGDYSVDSGGQIMMPLIGRVTARGLTTATLAHRLEHRFGQDYLQDPDVSVALVAGRPYYIHGAISRPGAYAFSPDLTIEKAIATAGGFGDLAERRAVSVARGDIQDLTLGLGDAVRPGDVIYVRERVF